MTIGTEPMEQQTNLGAKLFERCRRELIPATAFAFAWCAVTFGAGWLIGKLDQDNAPLYVFWAGMAYMWGLGKLRSNSNSTTVG